MENEIGKLILASTACIALAFAGAAHLDFGSKAPSRIAQPEHITQGPVSIDAPPDNMAPVIVTRVQHIATNVTRTARPESNVTVCGEWHRTARFPGWVRNCE